MCTCEVILHVLMRRELEQGDVEVQNRKEFAWICARGARIGPGYSAARAGRRNMGSEYGERWRLGTRYKRENKRDLFTHELSGQVRSSVDEGSDEALRVFWVGVEGERQAGAEHSLDGFGIEQAFESLRLVDVSWEGVPDEQRVALTTVLKRADIGFGGLEARGGGNLAPGPMQDFSLPDGLERAANPVWIVLGAGPAFLGVLIEGFRAVADGAAQGRKFFGVGGLYEPAEDCFQKHGAVEVTVLKTEVQKWGVAGIFFGCRWGHRRIVACGHERGCPLVANGWQKMGGGGPHEFATPFRCKVWLDGGGVLLVVWNSQLPMICN